jgi:hypothetical protein
LVSFIVSTLRLRWQVSQDPPFPRLLKSAQVQGGLPEVERDVLKVRRSERRGKPTPQLGLFQQPASQMEA